MSDDKELKDKLSPSEEKTEKIDTEIKPNTKCHLLKTFSILSTSLIFIILSIIFIYLYFSKNPTSFVDPKDPINQVPKLVPYETPNKLNDVLDYLFYPYHSDIIRTMDDYEFLRDSLGKVHLRMIFHSDLNGDYAKDVHEIGNTHHLLVLMETEHGNRFGGYTADNFNPGSFGLTSTSIDVVKRDDAAFLFNLDKKKVYPINQKNRLEALDCDEYYTVSFGENDLFVRDNFLNKGGSSNFPDKYGEGSEPNELTNGEKEFKIRKFEMYVIIFFEEFGDELNKMGNFKNVYE